MTLREKQFLFSQLMAEFISWTYLQGYAIIIGEVLRTKQQALWNQKKGLGIANSLHIKALAADLEFFKDGEWLRGDNSDHDKYFKALGKKWASMHYLCRSGYSFGDPYHFSITHGGVQ